MPRTMLTGPAVASQGGIGIVVWGRAQLAWLADTWPALIDHKWLAIPTPPPGYSPSKAWTRGASSSCPPGHGAPRCHPRLGLGAWGLQRTRGPAQAHKRTGDESGVAEPNSRRLPAGAAAQQAFQGKAWVEKAWAPAGVEGAPMLLRRRRRQLAGCPREAEHPNAKRSSLEDSFRTPLHLGDEDHARTLRSRLPRGSPMRRLGERSCAATSMLVLRCAQGCRVGHEGGQGCGA